MIDKFIGSLIWLVIAVLEVNLLLIAYVLGTIYLVYRSIRGKVQFRTRFIELSKEFINDLKYVFNEHKEILKQA